MKYILKILLFLIICDACKRSDIDVFDIVEEITDYDSVYSDKNISFSKIKECKFISVIKPKAGLLISIDITFLKEDTISAIVYNNNNTVLKLKATIK